MSERIEVITQNLASARAYLNAVLDQVGDRWETQIYTDGEQWNARQVVVHLAEADRGQTHQVYEYAEDREVVPPDFDLERYNQRIVAKRNHVTAEEARGALEANRAKLLDWLGSAPDSALDQRGRTAQLKIVSVEELLGIMAAHERLHGGDIARVLGITVS